MAETQNQRRIRALRRDARAEGSILGVGYLNETGDELAWTGDDEAPYVKVVNGSDGPIIVDATIVAPLPLPVSIAQSITLTEQGTGPDNLLRTLVVPTASSVDAPSFSYIPAGPASFVAKPGPGRIYQTYVFNGSGAVRTFQLFNLTGAPGGGAVPAFTPIELPDDTALFLDFGTAGGIFFSVGLCMASSSTVATFTASGGLHMSMVWK